MVPGTLLWLWDKSLTGFYNVLKRNALNRLPRNSKKLCFEEEISKRVHPNKRRSDRQQGNPLMRCSCCCFCHRRPFGYCGACEREGYLARPFDSEELARGIEWVLENQQRLYSLCENSRKKAMDEFDMQCITYKYVELYQEITEQHKQK